MSSFITTNQGRKPASAESAIEWLKTVRHFNCQAIINVISTLQAENFAMDDQVKELQEMMRCTDKAISHIPAAPQPPALGGEPEERTRRTSDIRDEAYDNGWNECRDAYRAHLAPLQAEIERLKEESFEELYNAAIDERDQLKARNAELESALKFYAEREHYHFESGNWDTVSGEPLNILWCGDEPDFIEDGSVARNALSKPAGSEQ